MLVPQLLDVRQVAQALSVSVYTVRRLAKAGRLHPLLLGCRRVLFDVREVFELIEKAKQNPSSETTVQARRDVENMRRP